MNERGSEVFLSRREKSTSWIGPQSGYVPTGSFHFVDMSLRESIGKPNFLRHEI
jgi:hypothetical protein